MEKIPNKPTIIYTGFSYEDLVGIAFKNTESRINVEDLAWVLSHVNYIVMDPFKLEQRSLECHFRGSTNQRVFKPVPYGNDGTLHLQDVTEEWDKGQLP